MTSDSYGEYLDLARLRALNQPRTQDPAEARFISIHHMAEILLTRQIQDLELAINGLRLVKFDLPSVLSCLGRVRSYTDQLIRLSKLMVDTISPEEFKSFRGALGGASGMQSRQFWEVEALSGYDATARGKLRQPGISEEDRSAIQKRLSSPDLWASFVEAVGHPGQEIDGLIAAISADAGMVELANAMRLHDLDWVGWRAQHALMVEALIGADEPGTGGSSGAGYLWSRTQVRFYPVLHQIVGQMHREP